jgi:hypothetical protein
MTLKEKFEKLAFAKISSEELRDASVDIVDDFAIGFTEWFADNTLRVDLDGYKTFGDADETEPHTIKELLQIYRKEKGL